MTEQNAEYMREAKSKVEAVAWAFHDEYEALAREIGYETRTESAVPWADVPSLNKRLMMGVVGRLVGKGVIHFGDEINRMTPGRAAHIDGSGALDER